MCSLTDAAQVSKKDAGNLHKWSTYQEILDNLAGKDEEEAKAITALALSQGRWRRNPNNPKSDKLIQFWVNVDSWPP